MRHGWIGAGNKLSSQRQLSGILPAIDNPEATAAEAAKQALTSAAAAVEEEKAQRLQQKLRAKQIENYCTQVRVAQYKLTARAWQIHPDTL